MAVEKYIFVILFFLYSRFRAS